MRVALIFDHQVRPDTTGIYVRRALGSLVEVEHILPSELGSIPRHGFDLYLNIDDGLDYSLPRDLHPCAWWAIDTHLNFDYCWNRAQHFDHVFCAQRDAATAFRDRGLNAAWLPLACDPQIHHRVHVPIEHDVCFVGNLFPGPRTELVELIQHCFAHTFVGQRFFEEMAHTYSASRIVFNRSIRNDINMRVFEGLACGSLVMTNDLTDNGQAELMQEGVHLACYQSAEELMDKIQFYLDRPETREKIAAQGRALALDRHTYLHRMKALLQHLERHPISRLVPVDLPKAPTTSDGEGDDPISMMVQRMPADAHDVLVLGNGTERIAQHLREQKPSFMITAEPISWREPGSPWTNPAWQAKFSVLIVSGLLEWATDPRRILQQLRSVLAPGGRLYTVAANARHHRRIRDLLEGNAGAGTEIGLAPELHWQLTRRDMEKLLYRGGWGPIACEVIPNPGHATWTRQGRPGTLQVGALHITGLEPSEVEEFHTPHYLVQAVPTFRPTRGLTSIIMLTHNQLAYTQLCLASIRACTDDPYELIVVDNASTDGTVEYLQSCSDVTLIRNTENRGFPAGCNQGIEQAKGAFLLLLNNDTVVTTGWLDRMLRVMEQDFRMGLVGPSSNQVSGEQQVPVRYDALTGLDGFAWDWGKTHDQQAIDTDRLVGFCLLMRREVVDHIGGLDERYGLGCFDDDDYSRRALQSGFRVVYAVDSFVHHFGGRTFQALGIDYAELLRHNQQLYQEKWASPSNAIALTSDEPPATDPPILPPDADVVPHAVVIHHPPLTEATLTNGSSTGLTPTNHPRLTCRTEPDGLRLVSTLPEISLCMIVRNNAHTIRPCLESIRPWVDEMIVVDTGSTDDTPRIAAELGAKVFHFPWCDDFSAARNESVRHAAGEWIFWMDSDDVIPEECGRKLRDLPRHAQAHEMGFTVDVHCPGKDPHDDVTVVTHIKLFRNRPELRFEHRIHEQILPALVRLAGPAIHSVRHTDLYVVHSGYDHSPEGQNRKLERDLRILHRELEERPDHPFTLFNLGMTYTDAKRYPEAITYLERCIAHSGECDSHIRKAFAYLVTCRQGLNQSESADAACREGLRRFPLDAELRFRHALLLHQQHRYAEAIEAYRDVLNRREPQHFRSVVAGIQGYLARHNLALVYEDAGLWEQAEEQWRIILSEQPSHRPAWRALGLILLRRGKTVEAISLAEQMVAQPRLRCDALLLQGEIALAHQGSVTAQARWNQVISDPTCDDLALEEVSRKLFEQIGPLAAQPALELLVQRIPEHPAALHNLGNIYLHHGQPDRAVEVLRQSLRWRPDSPATQALLQQAQAVLPASPAPALMEHPSSEITDDHQSLMFQGRSVSIRFRTRGPVDRAILHDLWERDVYGLASIPGPFPTVLDIGAHLGAFTRLIAMLDRDARILACEADSENAALLREHTTQMPQVTVVEAAVVGSEVTELLFHAVPDKRVANSGGGSGFRPEPGSVPRQVPAISITSLWRLHGLTHCNLLKLDCEGAEAGILQRMAEDGLLARTDWIVGEWHAPHDHPASVERTLQAIRTPLLATHEVEFRQPIQGREGHFTARPRSHVSR